MNQEVEKSGNHTLLVIVLVLIVCLACGILTASLVMGGLAYGVIKTTDNLVDQTYEITTSSANSEAIFETCENRGVPYSTYFTYEYFTSRSPQQIDADIEKAFPTGVDCEYYRISDFWEMEEKGHKLLNSTYSYPNPDGTKVEIEVSLEADRWKIDSIR